MKYQNKLKDIVLRGGVDENAYQRILPELHLSNRSIVRTFSTLGVVSLALLFMISIFTTSSLHNYMPVYGGALMLVGGVWLLATYPGKENRKVMRFAVYLFAIILFAIGVMLGTVLSPHEIAAAYIAFLLVVPQLFSDRPFRMYLLIVISVIVFVFFCIIFKDKATWNSDITNSLLFGIISLMLCTYTITNRVQRYDLQEKIRFMAENDQLTGVRNRNSFEQAILRTDMLKSNSIYCVYVDVNGLHEMNNSKGHASGDRMLQFVAAAMQRQFGLENTYRLGGDEFVALGMDRTRTQIDQNTEVMRREIGDAGYHIAVGISYMEKKGFKVADMIKAAEKEMYDDKARYYRCSNMDRRRRNPNEAGFDGGTEGKCGCAGASDAAAVQTP